MTKKIIKAEDYHKMKVGKVYEFVAIKVSKENKIYDGKPRKGKLINISTKERDIKDSKKKAKVGNIVVYEPLENKTPEGQTIYKVVIGCNMFKVYEL